MPRRKTNPGEGTERGEEAALSQAAFDKSPPENTADYLLRCGAPCPRCPADHELTLPQVTCFLVGPASFVFRP